MNKLMKYLNPLLILIATVLALVVSNMIFTQHINVVINNLITIIGLFMVGMFLSYRIKHNRLWVKKVIISLIMFVIVLVHVNVIQTNAFPRFMDVLFKNSAILYSIIIYCGWAFFE